MSTAYTQVDGNGPDDAELVRRAVEGDDAAFDVLVLRHRQSVLSAARSALGSHDEAEDVAQQAFLDAFAGLPGLREPELFRAWLLTITKRCAVRRRSRIVTWFSASELEEAVVYPLGAPPVDHAHADLKERVRAALQELSARSREVVTLHYLDGYACREIGLRLAIPEGTVRRILHESRKSLRVSMGVEPRGGSKPMTATRDGERGPRDMEWWINGNWPGPIMSTTLARTVCLVANKTPMTIKQISKAVDANEQYVKEALQPLAPEGLMHEAENGRFRAGFIALDAADWIEVTKDVRRQGAALADSLIPDLPALEAAWNETPKSDQGFAWAEGIWPMLAIMVLNIGLRRNGAPAGPQPEEPARASGKRYWAGGREEVSPEHVLWCTGFNNTGGGSGFGYGCFWSYGLPFDRPGLGLADDHKQVLKALVSGAPDADAVAQMTGQPLERAREIMAKVLEIGLARRSGDELALTFPVFRKEDDEVLAPVVDGIAGRLSREIAQKATAGVSDLLRKLGYGHLEEQSHQWRMWLEGNVAGEALRELFNRGILPHPGDPAPLSFATIGWVGDLRLRRWEP
jgi:RNA polymerase sigma-70 factor, ECF subfamily